VLDSGSRHRIGDRASDAWLIDDLQKLNLVVVGGCFEALNFWQRQTTAIMIYLATKVAIGNKPQIELLPHGWRLSPDCSDGPAFEPVAAQPEEPFDMNALAAKSYARDYASQRARVALRPSPPEALDKYFEPENDDEDTGEFSPLLTGFRERNRVQLAGV